MNHASPALTPERIMQFAGGYGPPLAIEAAIHHRVFDVLDESPRSMRRAPRRSFLPPSRSCLV